VGGPLAAFLLARYNEARGVRLKRALRCNSLHAFDENEVYESNKYNLSVTVVQNIIYVYSLLDLWIIQRIGKKRYFLYHQNKKFGNKNYHFQQEFTNLDDVFQYIHRHDKYVLKSKWSLPQQLEDAYRKARRYK
jgi:hypothetical protein